MKFFNTKKLMPALLAALFVFTSCQNPNDQPVTENEITEGGETIISEITSEEPTATSETTSATTESATTDTSAATEEPPTTEPPETEPPEPETTTSVSETAESQTTATTTEMTNVTTEEATAEKEETTVTEPEIEAIEGLPDAIFIRLVHYAHKSIFGFYIDNKGVIREFEIRDETTPYGKNMNDVNYCMNIVKEIYSGLEDISADMGLRVKKDDLILYYNMLLSINKGCERKYLQDYPASMSGFDIVYGIRENQDDELQIVILHDFTDSFDMVREPDVEELSEIILGRFPKFIDPLIRNDD